MNTISKDVALLLCSAIRQENRGKWYTLAGLQCWVCMRFSKGNTAKMCFNNQPDYRGCTQVNKRYDKVKS